MRKAAVGLICVVFGACAEAPTMPRETAMLSAGAWTGDGCLEVTTGECELVVGCGHGVFSQPTIRADGTFDVEGTYRVEAGPISINPAPPATFSGVLNGQTLTLTVAPHDGSRPATYVLHFNSTSGRCVTACV